MLSIPKPIIYNEIVKFLSIHDISNFKLSCKYINNIINWTHIQQIYIRNISIDILHKIKTMLSLKKNANIYIDTKQPIHKLLNNNIILIYKKGDTYYSLLLLNNTYYKKKSEMGFILYVKKKCVFNCSHLSCFATKIIKKGIGFNGNSFVEIKHIPPSYNYTIKQSYNYIKKKVMHDYYNEIVFVLISGITAFSYYVSTQRRRQFLSGD